MEITREELEKRAEEYRKAADQYRLLSEANFGAMEAIMKLLQDLIAENSEPYDLSDLSLSVVEDPQ